jgi:V/A-type H+-transporting ATPase subunit I
MSIVRLERVTLVGLVPEKDRVLAELQEIGCLHLIPLADTDLAVPEGTSSKAREALKFLLACPQPWRQSTLVEEFDAVEVEERALDIRRRLLDLEDEMDTLAERIDLLQPFGDFEFPKKEELAGHQLWLYAVPAPQMSEVETSTLAWSRVNAKEGVSYVAVLSRAMPSGFPVEPLETGETSLRELERQYEKTEIQIEDLRAERASLSRWLSLYMRNLDRLEDHAALEHAKSLARESDTLFAIQGWAPTAAVKRLKSYAASEGLALEVRSPGPDDTPPITMQNPQRLSFGEELLAFYQLPGYRDWDPSSVVFVSFAIFFAMILADAGYGLLLGLALLLFWKRLAATESARGLRQMMSWIVVLAIAFGAMLGSYFGVAPAAGTLLGRLKIMDINDFGSMMQLSIAIGGLHVMLANATTAWHRRSSAAALAPVGWVAVIAGGLAAYIGLGTGAAIVGAWTIGFGALLVLLFSGTQPIRKPRDVVVRLVAGVKGVAGFSGLFGDVLSYLRLFALGLASGSLALTFNGLAAQVADAGSRKGIAFLLGLVVLLLGHGLNLILGLISGVVHGLRLNLIEFYKWSVFEEGSAFRPFRKKEDVTWIP